MRFLRVWVGLASCLFTVDAVAQLSMVPPWSTHQVLFILDASSSMTENAFVPEQPAMSRWDVVQEIFPDWLDRLGGRARVGVTSVGGNGACDEEAQVRLPVGSSRVAVAAAFGKLYPSGPTNLNRVLLEAPSLFEPGRKGSKHIYLLSDGLNTCAPQESTCEIARRLHREHGISISVAAWVTEPGMVNELTCVATETGGVFTSPNDLHGWLNSLPSFDWWRYLILILGITTLFFGAVMLYRHTYHGLHWPSPRAVLVASTFAGFSGLLLYMTLFTGAGMASSIFGLVVLGILVVVGAQRSKPLRSGPPTAGPGFTFMVAIALLLGVWPAESAASAPTPEVEQASGKREECRKLVQGAPRYHHILALDVSGTTRSFIWEMSVLITCYSEMYVLPGEEVSLVLFGLDEQGTIRKELTFTVPSSGSTMALKRALDNLSLKEPGKTKTYFQPLAEHLTEHLKKVRLDPVVIVLSDGISDGFKDAEQVAFREIPFESLGNVYAAPNIRDWKVAIQGGSALELAMLFQNPLPTRMEREARSPLAPPIDPCLVKPDLVVETPSDLKIRPKWTEPFSNNFHGVLVLTISHECVDRYRSFTVHLTQGGDTHKVGSVRQTLLGKAPKEFAFPVSLNLDRTERPEAEVKVLVQEGEITNTYYPVQPSTIALKAQSYWGAHGWYVVPIVLIPGFLGLGLIILLSRRRTRRKKQPQRISIFGGGTITLAPGQHAPLTGPHGGLTSLFVPEVPANTVIGYVQLAEQAGYDVALQAAEGYTILFNGQKASSGQYRFGEFLQICHQTSPAVYNVSLRAGGDLEAPAIGGSGFSSSSGFGMPASPAGGGVFPPGPTTSVPGSGDGASLSFPSYGGPSSGSGFSSDPFGSQSSTGFGGNGNYI